MFLIYILSYSPESRFTLERIMNPVLPQTKPAPAARLLLPKAPVLTTRGKTAYWLTPDGECDTLTGKAATQRVAQSMPLVCHAPATARRLGIAEFAGYDLLELFAFVHPGKFCAPSPAGLAFALSLLPPDGGEGDCIALLQAARHLLLDLSRARDEKSDAAALARVMAGSDGQGWAWAPFVLAALGAAPDASLTRTALHVWNKIPEWPEHAPEAAPGQNGLEPPEVKARLFEMLAPSRQTPRPQQESYACALTQAFAPRPAEERPNLVLAEAGTGVGKTLGYLAPATLWAEKNLGPVWVSTFTRNLQRQIEGELSRLYPLPEIKERKVAVRKGRENYLCLLNFEDAVNTPALVNNPRAGMALGLIARWIAVTRDGDLSGSDFPGWLPSLLGWNSTQGLADRRGECIYAACPHYRKCFVEKNIRQAHRADIVIANHALVMHLTSSAAQDADLPGRYVFDEGHHLFSSADSAFSLHLCGSETADLRRWMLGSEQQGSGRSRLRGLRRRIEDLIQGDGAALATLDAAIEAARALPGPDWMQRLNSDTPKGAAESFLHLVQKQVHARAKGGDGPYSLETEAKPVQDGLLEAAYALNLRLNDLRRPLLELARVLARKLDEEAATLDSGSVGRLASVKNSLLRHADGTIAGWMDMLGALSRDTPPEFCDWMQIERIEGKDYDAGLYRHWVDPMTPFATTIRPHAHGIAVTSATLRDATESDPEGWQETSLRLGVPLLDPDLASTRVRVASPFDYKANTKIIVVRDVAGDDPERIASAFRELFLAAGGGALGLFTAVQRLKSVHARLEPGLEKAGIPLYAQHIDPMNTATLIDLFRMEENACLLGTDAARDGIDVPGRSLRLIVFDRVPWPRPTILHKARRAAFGKGYDDSQTRARLKQAYGRLIRHEKDRGVFVMLDSRLPTRLTSAFPEGVAIERIGLAEAVTAIRAFLSEGDE